MTTLLLMLLACDPEGDAPVDSGPGLPELVIDPAALDLGVLPYDGRTEVEAELEVLNRGSGALALTELLVLGGDASPFALISVPDTNLLQGERVRLGVRAMALGAGAASDTLRLSSNDPARPVVEVPLSLFASGPGLSVEPAALDLGAVPMGCALDAAVSLANSGDLDLSINAVQLDGGQGFELDLRPSVNGALPWTLAPGQSLQVGLRFAPSAAGADAATLRVNSSDPLRALVEVPLSAEVEAGEELVTSLRLDAPVDLVLLADTSPSTAAYLDRLARDLPDLAEALGREEADWRLWVSVSDEGCAAGGGQWIDATRSSAQQQAELRALLAEAPGALAAQGLARGALALDAADAGCNAGLLREGATPALLFVSTVDDAGEGAVSEAVEALRAPLAHPSLLRVNALAGDDPDGCEGAAGGVRYARAAELTGGEAASICASSYRSAFALMAAEAADAALRHVPLEQAPVLGTLRIELRGVERDDGWTWLPDEQALVLDASLRASAGDSLGLRYVVQPEDCPEAPAGP